AVVLRKFLRLIVFIGLPFAFRSAFAKVSRTPRNAARLSLPSRRHDGHKSGNETSRFAWRRPLGFPRPPASFQNHGGRTDSRRTNRSRARATRSDGAGSAGDRR